MHPVFLKIAYGYREKVSEHAVVFGIQQKDGQKGTIFIKL